MSYGRAPSYPWHLFAQALHPTSIEHGSNVTRWRDISGHGAHASPTGTVTYSGTGVPGAVFAGASCLGGTIAGADVPASIWILVELALADVLGPTWLYDMKGPHLYDSLGIMQSHTSFVGFRGPSTSAGASYSPATLAPTLVRVDFRRDSAALWLNGNWRGGAAIDTGAAVALSAFRIGERLDHSFGASFKGSGFFVLLGEHTDEELDRVDRELLDMLGIGYPSRYPLADANTVTSSPRLLLPAEIDVIAGRPDRSIFKTSARDRNGSTEATDFRSSRPLHAWAHDRWTFALPSSPGREDTVTIYEGDESATAILNAVAMIGAGDDPIVLECFGDSNAAHCRYGFGNFLQANFDAIEPGLFTQVGSFGPESPGLYDTKNSGLDGATISGTFNALGSPFFAGGATLDMAAHFASLAATPTHLCLLTGYRNKIGAVSTDPDVEAACDAEESALEAIIANARAAAPTLKIIVCTGVPQNSDTTLWAGGQSGWYANFRRQLRGWERIIGAFDGRQDEGVIVCHSGIGIDTWRGFRNVADSGDPIHVNMVDSHRRLAEMVMAAILAYR